MSTSEGQRRWDGVERKQEKKNNIVTVYWYSQHISNFFSNIFEKIHLMELIFTHEHLISPMERICFTICTTTDYDVDDVDVNRWWI